MWLLARSQAVDKLIRGFGPWSRGQWVRCFGPVGGAASLCSQCTPTRGVRCECPAGVSGVGPQSANLGAGNWASGERTGCLSRVHHPGAEGGGAPEAAAAVQSSLISRWVPLIFFFFLRNSSYSSSLVQTCTWLLTQLILALSQESCSRPQGCRTQAQSGWIGRPHKT